MFSARLCEASEKSLEKLGATSPRATVTTFGVMCIAGVVATRVGSTGDGAERFGA